MTTATRFDSALDAASERTSLQPRITDLVLARVRLRARRRVAWLRAMWRGLGELPSGSAVHAEVDACLADRDAPDAEAAWLAAEPSIAACNEALRDVESSLSVERFSRLAQLRALFGLEPAEVDVVHACLALALDPSLARVYAYLNDHGARAYATESLVARLFGHGRTLQWSAESPLRRWEIVAERDVAPGEPALLECDAAIRAWLIGTDGLDPLLVGAATLQRVYEPLPAWPVSQTAALLKRRAEAEQVECVRLRIDGARGSGRRSFAGRPRQCGDLRPPRPPFLEARRSPHR